MTSTIPPPYSKLPLSLHRTLPLTQQMSQEKDKCCKCETIKTISREANWSVPVTITVTCVINALRTTREVTFEKGN